MAKQTVTLQPGQSQRIAFEATPHEAKPYQVVVDGLTGSFKAVAIPDIKLTGLTWDATPPFDTGSRHSWTVTIKNLAVGRLTYQLEMYMNGQHFMGYLANLYAGEVREYSQPYHFGTEGSYTLTIKAYYEGTLLDEISSTVTVRAPVAPPFIDGELLIAFVLPWEQIVYSNQWPANTAIVTRWRIKNTGNVVATFRVTFMGRSGSVALNPGESDWVEFTINTGPVGSYSYTMNLYGDSKLVESHSIGVTTI